jgi:tetratricopeptide (TPR) repeat protein
VPAEATQVALIKTLLRQLLDQNVGNVTLYRCLANVLELGSNTGNPEDAEDALWYVLGTALEPCKDAVLVIDGLDALESDESKQLKVFDKLYEVAEKHKNVRVIILTKPFSVTFPKPTRQVTIDSGRTKEDVKHITRSYLLSRGISNEREIEELSENVAQRSEGSLIWADMTLQLLQKEDNVASMLAKVKEIPSTIKEVMEKHISSISLKGEARFILSWMLVAKRPLTTIEVQNLLELNISKGTYQPRSSNIIEDIQRSCGSLVVVQDKTLYFRNESIRLHLLDVSKEGKQLLAPADANRDITTRLLLYNKVCVTRNTEPSMEPLEPHTVDILFRSNALLEYSVRNWANHFKSSPFFAEGQLQPVTPEFKNAFPNSTLLALLERSCWEKGTLMSKANESHVLAFQIRKAALGEQHRCVLQSSINVAKSFEKLSAPTAASEYYYQASRLGQAVLGKANDISVACAVASVDLIKNLAQKTRTDEVTRKEEMLKYIVDVEKQQHGASSSLATKYNNILAQLYTDIQENDKAEVVYREIYQTSIEHHGEFSGEASTASEKLSTVLYKGAKHEDVVKYQQPLFESAERNLEIFDIRRVEITLRVAKTYEEKGDAVSAEEVYISLWRGLAEYCRAHEESSEAHERKIQVTISYAKFLKGQKRQAEAENILHGIWLDYQHRSEKTESLVAQLKLVAEELTAMGLLETAIHVFKSICGWFKSSGKQHTAESVSTATSLLDTVQKKSEKKKEENAKRAALTGSAVPEHLEEDERDEEAEAIMEEVVEAVTTAPAAKATGPAGKVVTAEVGETTLQTCERLSTFYMSRHRWSEAINVCQKMVKQLWPTVGQEGQFGFPKEHTAEAIKLARRLAVCYSECSQTEQAEKIYIQLFESALTGLRIQDAMVAETAQDLINLYMRTKQYSKALIVYQQLLQSYRTGLGARNALTLQTLYTMGDFSVKYHLKGADRYYLEITNASKDASGIISRDSMRAALTLSKIYYEQKRCEEARTLYVSLWTTFTKRAKEYSLSTEVAQSIYSRYTYVLTTQFKADTETVRQITVAYRDTCHEVYGAESEIATASTLQLAEVCQKSPEHHEEGIQICQQVIAKISESPEKTKAPGQLEILAKAKRHLASLYSSATAASSESTAQATSLWKEQLEANKKELGVSHKSTLASLAALVGIHSKSDKQEVQAVAKEHLQTAVVEVVSTEKDSTKLLEAAVSLAKMYISSKLTEQAWLILKDLRSQVISKEIRANGKFSAKLPETVDRRAFVFVAAFEETLRSDQNAATSFSDIMTDLLTESILFDRYHLSLRQKDVSVQLKLFDGARLYSFLKGKEQHAEQLIIVENVLFDIFIKNIGASIKTNVEVTRLFFAALLEELGRHQRNEDIIVVGCFSGTNLVHSLLEADRFDEAYEVATCVYQFIASTQGFSKPKNIASTFKLSLYLAGLGAKKSANAALNARMVELSKSILRETLAACKSLDIDLVQLQATELNDLVRLMGEQKNYTDLEASRTNHPYSKLLLTFYHSGFLRSSGTPASCKLRGQQPPLSLWAVVLWKSSLFASRLLLSLFAKAFVTTYVAPGVLWTRSLSIFTAFFLLYTWLLAAMATPWLSMKRFSEPRSLETQMSRWPERSQEKPH